MTARLRPLLGAATAALAIVALAIAPAHADDDDEYVGPSVALLQAGNVGSSTATLSALVTTRDRATNYRFEYGPTPAYGQSVSGTVSGGDTGVSVSAALGDLAPDTAYYIEVFVWNSRGADSQVGSPFTTKIAPAAPAPGSPTTVSGPDTATATGTSTPEPTFGESMVVAPVQGTVKVREPGAGRFVVLRTGDAVPVGSLVDTRAGAVALTSELSGGRTQTATFGDGLFQVRQPTKLGGVTDIVLRGGSFAACRARSGARAAAAGAPTSPRRRLWANDRGGRFRTKGRNSVATVRGTRWVTTDTCAGTRTSVTSGAVSVRDLRAGRTVVVRKGESYLARGRR